MAESVILINPHQYQMSLGDPLKNVFPVTPFKYLGNRKYNQNALYGVQVPPELFQQAIDSGRFHIFEGDPSTFKAGQLHVWDRTSYDANQERRQRIAEIREVRAASGDLGNVFDQSPTGLAMYKDAGLIDEKFKPPGLSKKDKGLEGHDVEISDGPRGKVVTPAAKKAKKKRKKAAAKATAETPVEDPAPEEPEEQNVDILDESDVEETVPPDDSTVRPMRRRPRRR